MADGSSLLYGIVAWPTMDQMVQALRSAGLSVTTGRYAITINDCEHFGFEEYGGDLGEPRIDADANSVERMLTDALLVSAALKKAEIDHRFEIYDNDDELRHLIVNGSLNT